MVHVSLTLWGGHPSLLCNTFDSVAFVTCVEDLSFFTSLSLMGKPVIGQSCKGWFVAFRFLSPGGILPRLAILSPSNLEPPLAHGSLGSTCGPLPVPESARVSIRIRDLVTEPYEVKSIIKISHNHHTCTHTLDLFVPLLLLVSKRALKCSKYRSPYRIFQTLGSMSLMLKFVR